MGAASSGTLSLCSQSSPPCFRLKWSSGHDIHQLPKMIRICGRAPQADESPSMGCDCKETGWPCSRTAVWNAMAPIPQGNNHVDATDLHMFRPYWIRLFRSFVSFAFHPILYDSQHVFDAGNPKASPVQVHVWHLNFTQPSRCHSKLFIV